jgi:endonuclease YncB( thermonuclease family)
MKNFLKTVLLIAIFISSVYAAEYATLKKIKDGDTFEFESDTLGRYNCRLYGIDTPEKFGGAKLKKDAKNAHSSPEKVQEAGKLATGYAIRNLSINYTYRLFIDGKDKFGRYLCVVFMPKSEVSFNENIVRDGYAVVYKKGKYTTSFGMKSKLDKAQFDAIYNKSGLWQDYYYIMKSMMEK